MYDCKIRWGYLSRSALRRFGLEEEQERQKRNLLQLSKQEQEIVSFSMLTKYMQQGGFLQFFSCWDETLFGLVQTTLQKIGAETVKNLLEQGHQLLQPVLQRQPNCTPQELRCSLTEAEKQQLDALEQAYQQEEVDIYYRAFCYYAG